VSVIFERAQRRSWRNHIVACPADNSDKPT
jgi:hypothetical protein